VDRNSTIPAQIISSATRFQYTTAGVGRNGNRALKCRRHNKPLLYGATSGRPKGSHDIPRNRILRKGRGHHLPRHIRRKGLMRARQPFQRTVQGLLLW